MDAQQERKLLREIAANTEFRKRAEKALGLYERMVPYGIDRWLPLMVQEFQRNQLIQDIVTGKRKVHQLWWVRALAVFGVLLPAGSLAVAILALVHSVLCSGGHC